MSARILLLDIERIDGRAEVPFWDLGDYKNRRIHADYVTRWPRAICAAWMWHGEPLRTMEFGAEWDDGTDWLQRIWEAYDAADIVIGHNIVGFDTPKLNSEWLLGEYGEPSPYKTVDTLKVARAKFGFESNTLNALAVRLGVPAKVDKYDREVAENAVNGVVSDQRRIKRYNKGDVVTLGGIYDKVLGWIPNHPHMGLWVPNDGRPVCENCGKPALAKSGTRTTVAMRQAYQRYRCTACGKYQRGKEIVHRIEMPK